ncbi:protein of unknown function [Hyphomicrobium sp. 1Nfss2.1]
MFHVGRSHPAASLTLAWGAGEGVKRHS